jgi:AcrR family transcriptional regulator
MYAITYLMASFGRMPRPSLIAEKREELLPIVARAFADLGYRRTTTAELAERCGVQENILYRLWPDKKGMFMAAIAYVYDLSAEIWNQLLDKQNAQTGAERLLDYEARHHGEFGHYRIVFAGLSETDDPDIRTGLAAMYERYQQFVRKQVAAHRHQRGTRSPVDPALTAWALVGLGTVADIARELGLLNDRTRQRLLAQIGKLLLEASVA